MTAEYHKIQSVYRRTERGAFIEGEWSTPELEALAGIQWEWTEKVDGTNIRIWMPDGGGLVVGGRTDRAQIPATLLQGINALELDRTMPSNMTLYGEGYGAKINRGGNYRQDQSFVLFDVRVGDWWLNRDGVEDVAMTLGIQVVPVVGRGTLYGAIEIVGSGFTSTWGEFEAEGVVCRPSAQLFDRRGRRIICKVKSRDLRRMRENC